jgi:hypothetical protein
MHTRPPLYTYLVEFPWEAGIRQWDCIPGPHGVTLHPPTPELPAYVSTHMAGRCGTNGEGYRPTVEDVLQPRPAGQETSDSVAPEACQVIANGQHCTAIQPGAQCELVQHLRPSQLERHYHRRAQRLLPGRLTSDPRAAE